MNVSRTFVSTFFALGLATSVMAQTWTNTALPAAQRASALLSAMTFAEKTLMISGAGGPYVGNIPANSRLGIPALNLQDGPAGVADGVNNVTAFPAPITIAASWDKSLARQFGTMLGAESRGKGVHFLLAPMMNVARAYQAGRNFEGYGEDPVLSGAMAAAEVQGIQSQGVIATAKHFVCNDQETLRTLVSSDVDERTRQEIYYPAFLSSVRAGAGAVMASYNRVNSRYACESEALNATLKKLWGFNGAVMSDWGAGFSTAAAMNNGLDMDMYCGHYGSNAVSAEMQLGNAPSSELDGMVLRILTAMFQFGMFDNPSAGSLNATVTSAAHGQFARDAAAAGMALLKNKGAVLPLGASVHSIAVIGSAASASPISNGGGSSSVVFPYNITPLAGIASRAGVVSVQYAQGDGSSVSQAAQLAASSDMAIVCVGQQTSEGSDRANLSLPGAQNALISAVAAANPKTIVVMYESSATLMPWIGQVAAVVMAWYPGQENGNALAQVLFGDVNPSGKLPVSIPAAADQVPASAAAQFPGVRGHVSYSEKLLVGYRWYDAEGVAPLFPFGHGLSYTTFGYSNLVVGAVSPSGQAQIGFDLTNLGTVAGAEVAQLYLGFPAATGEPPKALKDFQKVALAPGQTQHVTFGLTWEDFATWDPAAHGWAAAPGTFQVLVGASSRDIRLTGALTVNAAIPASDLANAALRQPVTVSSFLSASTPGSSAVDGDTTSAWVSAANDPQWITVDLGVIKDLSRVRLQWGANYATSYQLLTSSNASTWTTAYSQNAGNGGTEDALVSGRARYVRLNALQRAGPGGYSLSEFAVFAQPQRPFAASVPTLPARIEAENYDTGGEGVGYFNTSPGNSGGAYRSDDVGIQATTDLGGGCNVGWINPGEWLEYTVNPPDPSALYNISVRVAAPAAGAQLRARLDGTVLGVFSVPNTGGYQAWQTVALTNIPLQGGVGSQPLRIEALSSGFNLNWVQLDRVQACDVNNIAASRPAAASSSESAAYPASNAVDADPTTRWASAFSDPQWMQVDLGAVENIARVRLIWENAFARSCRIDLSNDSNTWTTVWSAANGSGGITDLGALASGRYVRMTASQRATQYGDSLWEFEVYPAPLPAAIENLSPTAGVFVEPSNNITFTLVSASNAIPTNGVQLILNGIDVSSQLTFSGSASNWNVTFPELLPNGFYSASISFTNAAGDPAQASLENAFDTLSQTNLAIEAEDFDFGGGHFIDNPAPTYVPAANSYFMEAAPAVVGVDLTTPGNTGGEQFAYRNDSCGTQPASDVSRQKFAASGATDFNVGWWNPGTWLNYTRTFPPASYHVYGRLASGNGAFNAPCDLVIAGFGSTNQTTRRLGSFSGVSSDWQGWQWAPLRDSGGQLAEVALAGRQTLKMTSGNGLNANFYMFVPVPPRPILTASLINGAPTLGIPTRPGFNYMLVWKNSLIDPRWKLLRVIRGDGSDQPVADLCCEMERFYTVVAQ